MATREPSLRQIAKGLGVSHSLLSLWKQGKRSIRPDLEEKYWAFVTNSGYRFGDNPDLNKPETPIFEMVPRGGLEPPTHGFSIHCSTN
jgi:transcriptional regulator with XRE-family HTH domain